MSCATSTAASRAAARGRGDRSAAGDGYHQGATQRTARPLDDASARRFASGAVAAGRRRSVLWRSLSVLGSLAAVVLIGFTAIAISVNTSTAEPQEVVLAGSADLVEGARARLRIHVRDAKKNAPIRNAKVTALLHPDPVEAALKLIEVDVLTDEKGDAVVEFDPPATANFIGLELRVSSDAGADRLERRLRIVRPRKIFISTDKPLYQPSQTVHVAIKAVNAFTMRPAAGADVAVLITDPNGNKIFRATRKASEFGIVGVDFALADELVLGRYAIKATVADVESERAIEVRRYVLPKFDVGLSLNRSFAAPGEPVGGTVTAKYFFGKPVQGRVVISGAIWEVDKFEEKFRITGPTNEEGIFFFSNPAPGAFGTGLDRGDGALRVEASVTDGADHTETKAVMVTLSKDRLKVLVVPDGAFVKGLDNSAWVIVSKPDGSAAPASLKFGHGTFETDAGGVARVPLTDLEQEFIVDVRAHDGAYVEHRFDPRKIGVESRPFAIRIADPVIRGGKPLQLEALCSFTQGTLYLDLVREGHTIFTKTLEITSGRAVFATDLPPEAIGTMELHAWRVLPSGDFERDTRLIVVEPPQGLRMKFTPSKQVYRPGEEMPVTIEVTDAEGNPLSSGFTISVVDAAVFALHESRPGMERVYLAIEEDLLRPRWQLKPVDVATMFEDPSRARPVVACCRHDGLSPILESVTFGAKTEFFQRRARRFNDWLGVVAVGTFIILILLAFLAFVAFCVREAHRRFGTASAIGCAFSWLIGLGFVFIILPVFFLGSKAAFAPGMAARDDARVTATPDAVPVRDPASPAAPGSPRIRQFFPETLYWNAQVVTGADGRANITLPRADSITSWKVGASAISHSGRMGSGSWDMKVFQDFFVDLDLPVALTQGDVVHVPVAVYNYRPDAAKIRLEIDAPGFELRDEKIKTVELGPGEVRSVYYRVRADTFGPHEITVKAFGTVEDAVRRTVEVLPDGKEIPLSASDRVLGRRSFEIAVPANAIDGATGMWVRLYPSTFSEVVTGLERLVRLPYG